MDSVRRPTRHWALRLAGGVGAAALLVVTTTSMALGQGVPSSNNGPLFSDFGPGRAAPGGAMQLEPPRPHEGAPGPLGAPAPGMPAPGMPAPGMPSPTWGGCGQNLSGTWGSTGQETSPTAFQYSGNVQVTQWGQWIQATETQGGGAQTQYYGRCQGDTITFDVYANNQFMGYQGGNVIGWGARWAGPRITFTWTSWAPEYATGTESWRRVFY